MNPSNPPAAGHSGSFPTDFRWGAATSAYQIEGSPLADGAGPSIWHRFSHTPGLVANGDTGDVACDHYRRFAGDVQLMKELGLGAYRFSIAWGRLLPEGTGRANPGGIDFYSRLIDTLLAHGIEPMVTLYHWDLPAALDDRGGWLNPDVRHWFAEYAGTAFRAYDDRVTRWVTLNEPWVVTDGGYLTGKLAPGHRNLFEAPIAAHHLLCAHGEAVRAFRAHSRGEIGIVLNLEPKAPASATPEDLAATRRADLYMNRQYLDPVLLGRHPDGLDRLFGAAWPRIPDADLALAATPIDFLGINYYTRGVTANDPSSPPVCATHVPVPGAEYTATGWEVHPASLTALLCEVKERYGDVPLYVTENGMALPEPARVDGPCLEDPRRVRYLRDHLLAVREAIRRGVDVRGYYAWSLLDNFEWAHGYSMRFGLIHVDFETQLRTLKRSAHYYREVAASRGAALDQPLPAKR